MSHIYAKDITMDNWIAYFTACSGSDGLSLAANVEEYSDNIAWSVGGAFARCLVYREETERSRSDNRDQRNIHLYAILGTFA